MSSVKMHLPFYDESVLTHILEFMNTIKNINIINIDKLKSDNDKITYNKICKTIFDNYHKKHIILGHYTKYPLPIPNSTKLLIDELSIKSTKKYVKWNYTFIEKKQLINNLKKILSSYDTHTFTINLNDKTFEGDVFKLWYLSEFNDVKILKTDELIENIFGSKGIEEYKFWNKLYVKDIKKFPDEYERVKYADLSFPILVIKIKKEWVVLDGYHRLIKAYRYEYKNVKVKFILMKQMIKTFVNYDEMKNSLSLVVKIK